MVELKPFVAVQRVRLPPGKGAARQPEHTNPCKPCIAPERASRTPPVWYDPESQYN
jgi:hypothetical protein